MTAITRELADAARQVARRAPAGSVRRKSYACAAIALDAARTADGARKILAAECPESARADAIAAVDQLATDLDPRSDPARGTSPRKDRDMTMTLKKLGDWVRTELKDAEARGDIPGRDPAERFNEVRYEVRVSNGAKSGPKINVTICGYNWLISDLEDAASRDAWFAEDGPALIAAVDRIVGRDRCTPPLGGVTKLGICLISATATTVRRVSSDDLAADD